jgi:hypothetical protein
VDYPRKHRACSLIVNASTSTGEINGDLGAMLFQSDEEGEEIVVTYASRQLLEHEKNYTPFLVEMQAMLWAINHLTLSEEKTICSFSRSRTS